MLGISGVSGKIWRNIPWIVIPTLLFSLIQSKLILPAHLALLSPTNNEESRNPILKLQRKVAQGMETFVDKFYRPTLKIALGSRYVVITIFIALFFNAIGLVRGERIKWEFFPEVEAEIISAKVKMVEGVAFETTSDAVTRIEEAAIKLNEKFSDGSGQPLIINMLATDDLNPDIAFLLDINPEDSFQRKQKGTLDRWELENIDFHKKVRDGYLKISGNDQNLWTVINANQTSESISEKVWVIVRRHLR